MWFDKRFTFAGMKSSPWRKYAATVLMLCLLDVLFFSTLSTRGVDSETSLVVEEDLHMQWNVESVLDSPVYARGLAGCGAVC